MSQCPGCEMLPSPLPTSGLLCLWPPLGHTHAKLAAALAAHGIVLEANTAEYLCLPVSPAAFQALRELAAGSLSLAERTQCKYLLLPQGEQPTLSDFGQVNSLSHLIARITGRWLVELLAERRLTTYFQPIVQTDSPDMVFAYECLLRGIGTTGRMIGPGELYDAAHDATLMYQLDRSARLQHIKAANQHGLRSAVFVNFNPTSIYDPEFCLRSTVEAIHGSDIASENFVFEVVESDRLSDLDRLPAILEYYRQAGFRVALDDLGAGYSSLNMLTVLRPDFVKLDMQLIRGIDCDPYKGEVVSKLIETAHNLKIQVIAEGIETVGEWNWAAVHGADYCQGYLFGRPDANPQRSGSDRTLLA